MKHGAIEFIAGRLQLSVEKINKVTQLFDEGSTIPFIARYRKELTGGLDEEVLFGIQKEWHAINELVKRKQTVLKSIKEQNKLTPDLQHRIDQCWSSQILEDIYLPFKKKKQTRAEVARKKGLETLAKIVMSQRYPFPENEAKRFLNDQVQSVEEALQGAQDIIAEWINENDIARKKIRDQFSRFARIESKLVKKKETEAQKYRDYFEYQSLLDKCPSHRLLAIRRGEKEGFLRVKLSVDSEKAFQRLERIFIKANNESSDLVKAAIRDSYKRLLSPSIETEYAKISKVKADEEAIKIFANNAKQLLLSPPTGDKRTLGFDPGFRTGCKWVMLDEKGSLIDHGVIYPHPPQSKRDESKRALWNLLEKYNPEQIAIGNGTAGRETYDFVKAICNKKIEVYLVDESGASIYSASAVARDEFGKLDITVRGTISIARRLMDPMAELVKIEPKNIGVGQYQHDVDQKKLKEELDQVVLNSVNRVGVNVNTASKHLLSYVSGIGATLAQNIVDYRNQTSGIKNRRELKKVKGLGAKAFEQCAGFIRVPESPNPLDNTGVHPESYAIVDRIAKEIGVAKEQLIQNEQVLNSLDLTKFTNASIGAMSLTDIIDELKTPGRDPRGSASAVEFSESIKDLTDLKIGMELIGVVNNLTKFGAFVDLGIKESALLHISQITDRYISDPAEVLVLNQRVKVRVIGIEQARKRISVSMKNI